MTTLANLRQGAFDLVGLEEDDPFFLDAKMTRFINAALKSLGTQHDWWWLQKLDTFNLVSGQTDYTLPSDHRKTLSLYISNYPLEYRQPKDFISSQNFNNQIPVVYTTEANASSASVLKLGPIPNSTDEVTHVYVAHEPALSADGDEPLLPSEYDDYLMLLTAIRMSVALKDKELYTLLISERDEWVRKANDDARKTKAHIRIKTRRDWRV